MTEINSSMKTLFESQIDKMREAFEKTMTTTIKDEFEKIKTSFNEDIDALTARITALENRPAPTYAGAVNAANGTERNIVIRNLNEEEGENVQQKVEAIIKDGCEADNIVVEKVVRKKSKNKDKPGVVIATLQNTEQKKVVLEKKANLNKDNNPHKAVFIHGDTAFEQRVIGQNWRTFIKASNMEDKLEVKGNRVVKKAVRHNREQPQ